MCGGESVVSYTRRGVRYRFKGETYVGLGIVKLSYYDGAQKLIEVDYEDVLLRVYCWAGSAPYRRELKARDLDLSRLWLPERNAVPEEITVIVTKRKAHFDEKARLAALDSENDNERRCTMM